MRAPKSYTGEDVAELQGHGGPLVMQRLLEAVLTAGARMAEPGEFTRRAFEAGRIDLTRAESVAALIGARGERALRAAQAMNAGALADRDRARCGSSWSRCWPSSRARSIFPRTRATRRRRRRARGRSARSHVRCARWRRAIGRRCFDRRRWRWSGASTPASRACSTRSSGRSARIVDETPGTTRDAVEAEVALDGVAVHAGRHRGRARGSPSGWSGAGSSSARARRGARRPGRAGGRRRGRLRRRASGALWDAIAGAKLIAWNKRDLGRAARAAGGRDRASRRRRRRGEGVDGAGRGDRARASPATPRRACAVVSARQARGARRRRGDARARGGACWRRASRRSWRRSTRGARSTRWAASPARPSTPTCSTRSSRASASASERASTAFDVIVVLGAALGPEGDLGPAARRARARRRRGVARRARADAADDRRATKRR